MQFNHLRFLSPSCLPYFRSRSLFYISCIVVIIGTAIFDQLSRHNEVIVEQLLSGTLPFVFITALIIGLPHGAADPLISFKTLWSKPYELIPLISIYLGITVAVIGFWWIFPSFSFLLFWLYSAWHFGHDWSDFKKSKHLRSTKVYSWRYILQRSFSGLGFLGLCLWSLNTNVVISLVAISHLPEDFFSVLQWSVIFIPLYLFSLLRDEPLWNHKIVHLAEWGLMLVVSLFSGGILLFSVYFIFLHSVKHFQEHSNSINRLSRYQQFLVLLFLSVLAIVIVFGISILRHSGITLFDSKNMMLMFEVAIIGIAALSLPHIILVDWLRRDA